jgi:hypothetical protein
MTRFQRGCGRSLSGGAPRRLHNLGHTQQLPTPTRDRAHPTRTQRAPASGLALFPPFVDTAPMGVRTRGHDIAVSLRSSAADAAARDEARRVIERWNRDLAAGRDMWWSLTIRAALVAGMPWLDVHCPGCGTIRAPDIRTIDRHPLASVGSLVLGLRCSWCGGSAVSSATQQRKEPRLFLPGLSAYGPPGVGGWGLTAS